MSILSSGARLVNRLVPTVDAHAYCMAPYTVTSCYNHVKTVNVCGCCSGPQGVVCNCTRLYTGVC
jgi:hypothetical protein